MEENKKKLDPEDLKSFSGGARVDSSICAQCHVCIMVCPIMCVAADANGSVRIDEENCIGCGECINVCPTGAISY